MEAFPSPGVKCKTVNLSIALTLPGTYHFVINELKQLYVNLALLARVL